MKISLARITLVLALAFGLSINACSKKDGGSVDGPNVNGAADSNLTGDNLGDIKGGSGAIDSSSKDICNAEGDAYERFATLTHHSREYVYQMAQTSGFHAVYQAKPATYTKDDVEVIQNYYVQADKMLYGSLNAEIETAVIRFGAMVGRYGDDPTDEKWARLDRAYYALTQLLRARETINAAYSAVFGLSAAATFVPTYDGPIANIAPIKEFLAQLDTAAFAATYKINAFRKDRIYEAVATLSRGLAIRIADKDYVLHTNYSVEKKTAVVTLVDVANYEQALEFRPAKEEVVTALKAQYEAIATQLKDLEAKIEVAATNKTAELMPLREQYNQLKAEYHLLEMLGYGETRAVVEATLTPATGINATQQYTPPTESYTAATGYKATYTPPAENNNDSWAVGATATVTYQTSEKDYVATYNNNVRFVWTPQYRGQAATPVPTPQ